MATPILLLNAGSSSIKYQVINGDTERVVAKGTVQRIGDPHGGVLDHTAVGLNGTEEHHVEEVFADHDAALQAMAAAFEAVGPPLSEMVAVGHRTVHGGTAFRKTTIIDDSVVAAIVDLFPLAPLHNPAGLAGIEAARRMLPDVPHVAVFDTAFFAHLPAEATTYAIDRDLAERLRIRKYGFHGTSHSFVSKQVPILLERDPATLKGRDPGKLKQVVCHLGNGASVSAIDGGMPIETSMGLTPLQGLVMGTRPGDIDPGLPAFLRRELNWDVDRIDEELNKNSGMLGLTGKTDMRDVEAMMHAGDADAELGLKVYVHRLVSYIGAYTILLGGLDVLTFTAGVGENSPEIRSRVAEKLRPFGVILDDKANAERSRDPRVISSPDSAVAVMVVPTNEELAMAREVIAAIGA